jgi:hypothetical protein
LSDLSQVSGKHRFPQSLRIGLLSSQNATCNLVEKGTFDSNLQFGVSMKGKYSSAHSTITASWEYRAAYMLLWHGVQTRSVRCPKTEPQKNDMQLTTKFTVSPFILARSRLVWLALILSWFSDDCAQEPVHIYRLVRWWRPVPW